MIGILKNGSFLRYGRKVIPGSFAKALTLIASKDFDVSTTSTTAVSIGSVEVSEDNYKPGAKFYIHIYDIQGRRTNYFMESDYISYFGDAATAKTGGSCAADSNNTILASAYGIYPNTVTHNNGIWFNISARYNASSSKTIDGTYRVDIYRFEE